MDHWKGWGVNHHRNIVNLRRGEDNALRGALREEKAGKVGYSSHHDAPRGL